MNRKRVIALVAGALGVIVGVDYVFLEGAIPLPIETSSSAQVKFESPRSAETHLTARAKGAPSLDEAEQLRVSTAIGNNLVLLMQGIAQGRANVEMRKKIVADGAKIPLTFIASIDEIMQSLHSDEKYLKRQFIGLAIDVADHSLAGMSAMEQSVFFETAHKIVDRELDIPEFVEPEILSKLSPEQTEKLLASGAFEMRDGQPYVSTFDTKVAAMGLIHLDPDKYRKSNYFETLSWKLRNTTPKTATLLIRISHSM